MNKKEDINGKELMQLSIEFPSNKLNVFQNDDAMKNISKNNTPVINLHSNDSFYNKNKADYINMVLNHTKSF